MSENSEPSLTPDAAPEPTLSATRDQFETWHSPSHTIIPNENIKRMTQTLYRTLGREPLTEDEWTRVNLSMAFGEAILELDYWPPLSKSEPISGTPDAATLQTLLRQSADYVPHLIVIGGTCCPAGFRLGGVCDCGRAERQASLRWLADALPGILDATEERDAARKRVGSLTASFLQQANEFSAFREISESKISELRAERSQLRARIEALLDQLFDASADQHTAHMTQDRDEAAERVSALRSAVLRSLEDTK